MILAHLKVIAAVTTAPSQAQATLCDLWIDGARAMLSELGLCWWDENDIPAAVTIPLTEYVAAKCCGAFGKNGKGYEAMEFPARAQIAGLKSSDQREQTRAVYY